MKTVRTGVFETNSSSTHSVTIMSKEDYKKWKDGSLLYDFNLNIFETEEERSKEVLSHLKSYSDEEYTDEDIQDTLHDDKDEYSQSFEDFCSSDLEVDTTKYTSKSGDEIVIICKYGTDN